MPQVLLLWDRVLALDDLHVLPTLAAAVFLFRSAQAKDCHDRDELYEVRPFVKKKSDAPRQAPPPLPPLPSPLW